MRGFIRGWVPLAFPLVPLLVLSVAACSQSRRIVAFERQHTAMSLTLPSGSRELPHVKNPDKPSRDTLKVTDLDGRELLIMRAIRDDETGEMVATEQLDAAVVTARFRNVAERHGRIDLEFQVIVPEEMHDSKWQLRFHPDMFILGDSLRLDDILITGTDYRKAQLKGYQQYERFLSRIVEDTLKFVRIHELEVFLKRNLPMIYAFRNDSTEVSDEVFESFYGVTERQAVEHYTNMIASRRNERRKGKTEKMLRRYVKAPIVSEGTRLDTVMRSMNGDFVYNYVQTVNTRPKLRKVDIRMSGEIYESDRRLYTVPTSEPLTFYISSVSAFVDGTERYLTKMISRNVEVNATCRIEFRTGRADIEEDLSDNRAEIRYIKENLGNLLTNPSFGMDSIIIVASASPEGSFRSNASLTYRRALSASDYFSGYIRSLRDSLAGEAGFVIEYDGETEKAGRAELELPELEFVSRSGGENWSGLETLVRADSLMSESQKEEFMDLLSVADPDTREKTMASRPWYAHVRDDFYPRLRTVVFHFHLHRKGMQTDTVYTSVLDSAYMAGVEAIRDHDYERALEYLTPYQDYNTAVAYAALDRNLSAFNILKDCSRTAQVNYMLALLYARQGDDENAVQCYLLACRQDPSFVHRGNLDPEISSLVRRYDLNFNEE